MKIAVYGKGNVIGEPAAHVAFAVNRDFHGYSFRI